MEIEGVEFEWISHDTFKIKAEGKVVYTDPYLVPDGEKADLILISHDHYDHYDPDSIKKLRKSDTVIVGHPKVIKLLGEGKALNAGKETTAHDIKIEAVPAYNMGKPYHHEGDCIGFVFVVGHLRVYFAGDTDMIQEMDELGGIDVALIPIGGKYVMEEEEAAEAVKLIKPRYAIPMHYGTITEGNPEKFKQLVGKASKVIIL